MSATPTMSTLEAFKKQWKSGGRTTLVLGGLSLLVLALVNTYLLFGIAENTHGPILENPSPQQVLTPEVKAGEMLVTKGTKCNRSDDPVVVFSTSYWVPVDPPGQSQLSTQGSAVREPGCVTREFKRAIEPNRAPGLYRIGGTDTVVDATGEVSTAGWYSETFRVINAGQP